MGGWKTWLAVIGGICTGVGMVIAGLLTEPMDWTLIGKGWAAMLAAWALLGYGHKLEKTKV
jgi:hypothetical protein